VLQEDIHILKQIEHNLESCILGKEKEIELLLTALIAGGHVLLEDVPGTGKTVLIKALAKSISGQYRRVQCNPDLLPTDITGVSIFHPKEETFIFRAGPVMTNILLTDEINRATTKTQAALLEAMEEKHVTVDGESYELPRPFLLLATQNPIDFEGTYTLPEAQLDRFMMKFQLGYPDRQTELNMISVYALENPIDTLLSVTHVERILDIQNRVHHLHIDRAVSEYALDIVRKTRSHPSVMLGASPRATLALIQAAKAYAYLQARNFVLPDDIKALAPYVLAHRLILHAEARMAGENAEKVLQSIIAQMKVPVRLEK